MLHVEGREIKVVILLLVNFVEFALEEEESLRIGKNSYELIISFIFNYLFCLF